MEKQKKKIILIDDNHHKGWGVVFGHIIKDLYDEWAEFECLQDISDEGISACYNDNPTALFIQDNQLKNDANRDVTDGIHWVLLYGKTRSIIMHSGDNRPDLGFRAAQYGAKFYMRKDDPANPMTNDHMKDQIIEFHKVIIKHLGLVPEFIWLVYNKIKEEEEYHPMDPDYVAQMKEDEREL